MTERPPAASTATRPQADHQPHRPRYLQIRDDLYAKYVEGRQADALLPPERTLAEEFGVARATLRKAIDELADEGLVYRIQGGGTYCVGPGIAKSLKLTSFSEDIRARGWTPSSRVLSASVVPAAEAVCWRLRLSPGHRIVEIRRLRLADGEPMCLEVCSLPAELVPGLEERDLKGSLYELLAGEYGLEASWAEQDVVATVLSPEDADMLGVAPFSPALRAERVSFDARSAPIEYAVSTYRADRYTLRYAVRR